MHSFAYLALALGWGLVLIKAIAAKGESNRGLRSITAFECQLMALERRCRKRQVRQVKREQKLPRRESIYRRRRRTVFICVFTALVGILAIPISPATGLTFLGLGCCFTIVYLWLVAFRGRNYLNVATSRQPRGSSLLS